MNCKPGDLAIVVRSAAGNEGRIVRCLAYVGAVSWMVSDDYWLIDQELQTVLGNRVPYARDSWMRPIRSGDVTDEEVRDLYAPKIPEAA